MVTHTLVAARIQMNAELTETVETTWPVLETAVATGSVSTPVTEPSVAPTPSVWSPTTGLSASVWTNMSATPTRPWAAPRWSARITETAVETRSARSSTTDAWTPVVRSVKF